MFEDVKLRLGFGLVAGYRLGFHGHVLNAVTVIGYFYRMN